MVTAHKNADPDAVGAAVGIAEAAAAYGSEPAIVFPEGLSKASKRLVSALGIEDRFLASPPGGVEALIVVDTANPAQLRPLDRLLGEAGLVVVVDHHAEGGLAGLAHRPIVVPEAASTSEIVAYAARLLRIPLSVEAATILYAGIMVDSRSLRITGPFTAEAVSYLLDMGARTSVVGSLAREAREKDTSERIALLKAASRLRYSRACNDVLIAVTRIGSFEASVARALIELGADVAVVVRDAKEGARVSIRVSQRAIESGVTATEVARYISERLGGEAGGHEAAAGVQLGGALSAEDIVERLARSLPGKVARICVEARRA